MNKYGLDNIDSLFFKLRLVFLIYLQYITKLPNIKMDQFS